MILVDHIIPLIEKLKNTKKEIMPQVIFVDGKNKK